MKPRQWKEPKEYPNPLQKYVDRLDQPYEQTPLTPRVAQYILKALDYLHIYSQKNNEPALIEQPLHNDTEAQMVDIIAYAPEESDGQTKE
jgi:hypothetical protein